MHRKYPATKNFLAQNVISAKAEKYCPRGILSSVTSHLNREETDSIRYNYCLFCDSLSWPSFPGGASGKEPACQCRRHRRLGFYPWVRKIPWRRAWQSTPAFLPGQSRGQRSLVGYRFIVLRRVRHD